MPTPTYSAKLERIIGSEEINIFIIKDGVSVFKDLLEIPAGFVVAPGAYEKLAQEQVSKYALQEEAKAAKAAELPTKLAVIDAALPKSVIPITLLAQAEVAVGQEESLEK